MAAAPLRDTLNSGCCLPTPRRQVGGWWAGLRLRLLLSGRARPVHRQAVKVMDAFHWNSAAQDLYGGQRSNDLQGARHKYNSKSIGVTLDPPGALSLARLLLCRLTCSSPGEGLRWPGQHSGCHALLSTQSKAVRWCVYPPPDPHKCAQTPCVLAQMCS